MVDELRRDPRVLEVLLDLRGVLGVELLLLAPPDAPARPDGSTGARTPRRPGACEASETALAAANKIRVDQPANDVCLIAQIVAAGSLIATAPWRMLDRLRVPLSWSELLKRTVKEAIADDVLNLAAQQAYYFFFALFPALLALIALASFFPLAGS